MADMVRKNYDGAVTNYKEALATETMPNSATLVRLAQVYMATGKLDNANFTLDKAINTPNVPTTSEVHRRDHEERNREAQASGSGREQPRLPAPAPAQSRSAHHPRTAGREQAALGAAPPALDAGQGCGAGVRNTGSGARLSFRKPGITGARVHASVECLREDFQRARLPIMSGWSFWATRSSDSW